MPCPTTIGRLLKPLGRGKYAVVADIVECTGVVEIDTGFDYIEGAVVDVVNSLAILSTSQATITSINAPSVFVVVIDHAAATNSVSDTKMNVAIEAYGFCHAEREFPG